MLINYIIQESQLENSKFTLRYKLDGSQTFVKFEGATPSFLKGKTTYKLSEILLILNNPSNGWVLSDI